MTARQTINNTATLLGWEQHGGAYDMTYVRGSSCIQVTYSQTDTVIDASRYHFYKVDYLQLRAQTGDRHKKETVLAWLADT